MLKKLILAIAVLIGAFAASQVPSQATPLGASAQAETAAPAQIDKVQYYYYRRYRPRYYGYRRSYRPRYYYYRPRRYRRFYRY